MKDELNLFFMFIRFILEEKNEALYIVRITYLRKIECVLDGESFKNVRSVLMRIDWPKIHGSIFYSKEHSWPDYGKDVRSKSSLNIDKDKKGDHARRQKYFQVYSRLSTCRLILRVILSKTTMKFPPECSTFRSLLTHNKKWYLR